MKKALCITMICSMLCALLCGCQPTPDKEIVVGKDASVYLEPQEQPSAPNEDNTENNGEPVVAVSFPTEHIESIDVGNANVTLNIDAKVAVPALASYPVYSAAPIFISQEMVDTAVKVLLDGKEMYNSLSVTDLTQAEVLERLNAFKQTQAELANENDSSDYVDRMIEFYEDKLKTAPVTIERTVNNGQFGDTSSVPTQDPDSPPRPMPLSPENDYNNINTNVDLGKETFASFSVHRSDSGKQGYIRLLNTGDFYLSGNYKYNSSDIEGLNLTLEQAKNEAMSILSEFGITDMTLAYSFSDMAINAMMSEQNHECYALVYTKEMNGLQAAYHESMLDIGAASEGDIYREPFPAEYILMVFDDTGLLSFAWETPTSVQMANANAAVLTFDEMMEYFHQYCRSTLSWTDESISSMDITITEIRLCLVKIPVSADEYLYVPAWDFIGTNTQIYKNKEDTVIKDNAAQSYFTVNAIDGSLVHEDR